MSMWKHRLRVTVFDESSFSEIRVFRGTPRQWLGWALVGALLIALGSYVLVARTPLREWLVPGYLAEETRIDAREARLMVDSAWHMLQRNEAMVLALRHALAGDSAALAFLGDDNGVGWQQGDDLPPMDSVLFLPNEDELTLRDWVQDEDRFTLQRRLNERGQTLGFPYPPVVGGVSEGVREGIGHLGLDLLAEEGAAIQAVDDGTVLFGTYTVETGYTLVLQHRDDRISVYKHCGTLLKQQGDVVVGGEAVAVLGNTGTMTTGPHLHFEWWVRGQVTDPTPWLGPSL